MILTDVVNGLEWLGHEIADWVPKGITIAEDAAGDVETLLPEGVQVITDVENLALAAIKDGGQSISSGQVLVLAITQAGTVGIADIAADEAVVAAFKGFVTNVSTRSEWTDVLTALSKLVADYDTFGAAAKAALLNV
jgi:hypothetical protein